MTLILHNGIVRTMDPAQPVASALALQDGRVLAAGSLAEVRAAAGPRAETLDLAGRLALPGLTDSHIHFLWFGLGLTRPNLDGARSLQEALARLAPFVAGAVEGAWIVGSGWNHEDWPVKAFPCREDLDAVSGGHPVLLQRKDEHSVWVNSRALALAGVGPGTPDPAGGRIDRDEYGAPTGILRESATELVFSRLPPPSAGEMRAGLKSATSAAHAAGLTGIHDMEGPEAFALFQEARARDELRLRVVMQIRAESLDHALALGLRTGFGDDTLRVGHVKAFADGSLGSQTAWMLEPYAGQPGNTGVVATPPEDLARLVRRATAGGIACAIHAIGDRANRAVLDILEAEGGGLRHRIEHVQLLHPRDVPRLAALGIVASMQPIHATSDRDMADRLWGGRVAYGYAWRSLLDSGAVLAFGSDCPVETLHPLRGIHAAVTRRRAGEASGLAWHPEQCITVPEAVAAYTRGAAYVAGMEEAAGTLRPGMAGDVTVLSQDIFAMPLDDIASVRADYTIVAGSVVYGS